MSFLIKDFGNDKTAATYDDCIALLNSDYAGKSVTVAFQTDTNRKFLTFVDVTEAGIFDSYKGTPLTESQVRRL